MGGRQSSHLVRGHEATQLAADALVLRSWVPGPAELSAYEAATSLMQEGEDGEERVPTTSVKRFLLQNAPLGLTTDLVDKLLQLASGQSSTPVACFPSVVHRALRLLQVCESMGALSHGVEGGGGALAPDAALRRYARELGVFAEVALRTIDLRVGAYTFMTPSSPGGRVMPPPPSARLTMLRKEAMVQHVHLFLRGGLEQQPQPAAPAASAATRESDAHQLLTARVPLKALLQNIGRRLEASKLRTIEAVARRLVGDMHEMDAPGDGDGGGAASSTSGESDGALTPGKSRVLRVTASASSVSSSRRNTWFPSRSATSSLAGTTLSSDKGLEKAWVDAGAFVTLCMLADLAAEGYPLLASDDLVEMLFVSVSAQELAAAWRAGDSTSGAVPVNALLLSLADTVQAQPAAHSGGARAPGARTEAEAAVHALGPRYRSLAPTWQDNELGSKPEHPSGTLTKKQAWASTAVEQGSRFSFRISPHMMRWHDALFDGLRDASRMYVLPREWLRHVVGSLGCPYSVAASVWRQADLDCDGHLDDAEFAVGHHLLVAWMQGHRLPPVLPSEIVPASKLALAMRVERGMRRVRKVFISYRWNTPDARPLALWLHKELLALSYESVFLDIKSLGSEMLLEQIEAQVAAHDAVVPLWTEGCYMQSRIVDPNDAVRVEVRTALKLNKVIVPLFVDRFWTARATEPDLPPDMEDVLKRVGVMYVHQFPEVCLRKLHLHLQAWV